jgi:glycosyltransferase involved in cell wall biosynthesis
MRKGTSIVAVRNKKLLFVTPNPIQSASERYRIYQFVPYLERAGFACTVLPFATRALHRAVQGERLAPKLLLTPFCYLRRMSELAAYSQYDLLLVHRGIFPFPWPALEKMLFRRQAKVIFDFDDAIHVGHKDIAAKKYPWMYRWKYGPGVNGMLSCCSHVIAGNRILAEHASKLNSHVSVVPTVVDLDQYEYRPPRRSNDRLTIGWVGSRSTSPYLLEIEAALRELGTVHSGKIRFRFYGDPQRQLNLPDSESLPFSLASEIEDLRTIDIGIMPMPDNDWTRGKCAFKAIQYMALGIPTVTSPVGMATELIQHTVNGFWARTPQDWFESLDRLVTDAELRKRFAGEGRKTIEQHYSLQTWGPRVSELLEHILEARCTIRASANSIRAET